MIITSRLLEVARGSGSVVLRRATAASHRVRTAAATSVNTRLHGTSTATRASTTTHILVLGSVAAEIAAGTALTPAVAAALR